MFSKHFSEQLFIIILAAVVAPLVNDLAGAASTELRLAVLMVYGLIHGLWIRRAGRDT